MQLIDKTTVVAEINRQHKILMQTDHTYGAQFVLGFRQACRQIIDFLDAFEVKKVDLEDEYMTDREIAMEKSILDETKVEYFATGNPTIAAYSEDNLRNQFDAGADWMKEQMIKAFAKTLEVKKVDVEKEMNKEWNKCEPIDEGMGLEIASIEHEQFDNIAKHFFELGVKAAQKGE